MKNDKLIEFIETTLKGSEVLCTAGVREDCLVVSFELGTLYFYDDSRIVIKDVLLDLDDLEAIHKICVAIKNNIFN